MTPSQQRFFVRMSCTTVIAVISSLAHAATLQCDGKITEARVLSDGLVRFQPTWTTTPLSLCRVTGMPLNMVEPGTCKGWYATLLTAIQTKADTTTYFDNTTATTCAMQTSGPAHFTLKGAP